MSYESHPLGGFFSLDRKLSTSYLHYLRLVLKTVLDSECFGEFSA